ncbi:hypothetical protein C3L33_03991, partial [Rhododendron williamsianum]
MEDKSTTTTTGIIAPTTPTAAKNGKTPPLDGEKNKKKRGAFTLFKAATLLIIRRRPEGKPKPEVPSKVTWKKIVGSICPFHLQDNQSPQPSAHSIAASPTVEQRPDDDVSTPLPPSPHAIINRSSANSDDGMSQYGSTTNLQELDKGSESRYASAVNLQLTTMMMGEMMGLQMRVQHLEKVERYNKMMVARGSESLGLNIMVSNKEAMKI